MWYKKLPFAGLVRVLKPVKKTYSASGTVITADNTPA